jgi:hypothetical protein
MIFCQEKPEKRYFLAVFFGLLFCPLLYTKFCSAEASVEKLGFSADSAALRRIGLAADVY